jgi:hypothetical protein
MGMVHIIAASIALLTAFTTPQDQEIPPLTKEVVLELLHFELPDTDAALISVLAVHQLDELGRAEVRVGAYEATVRLQCQQTDFGPKWRLAEPLPPELKSADNPEAPPSEESPRTRPPEVQTNRPEDPAETTPAVSYKSFLEGLFNAVRTEQEDSYAEFYYRDDDFALDAVAGENPLQQLADRRTEFMRQCVQLSLQLKDAKRFATISYFATRSSKDERAELRALMPQSRRYIKAVSVEIMVDGSLGTVVFEGLTLLQDGWRLGGITGVEIAQQGEAETPEPQ